MSDAQAGCLAEAVRWDDRGLAPAVVCHSETGAVLMLGWMNAEALSATVATGLVHFFSRSRQALWRKGETSGHTLSAREIRLDCDGDALLVTAEPAGPTCHTGKPSCFFRRAGQGRGADDGARDASAGDRALGAGGSAAVDGPRGARAGDRALGAGGSADVDGPRGGVAQDSAGVPVAAERARGAGGVQGATAWVEDAGPPGAPAAVVERLHAVLLSRRGAPPEKSYTASLLAGGPAAIAAKITEEAGELCAELAAGASADADRVAHEAADLLYFVLVGLVASDVAPAAVWRALESRFGQSGHAEKASRR
jgi:phosphoribosyl-ATP pyrophosphohydrolase